MGRTTFEEIRNMVENETSGRGSETKPIEQNSKAYIAFGKTIQIGNLKTRRYIPGDSKNVIKKCFEKSDEIPNILLYGVRKEKEMLIKSTRNRINKIVDDNAKIILVVEEDNEIIAIIEMYCMGETGFFTTTAISKDKRVEAIRKIIITAIEFLVKVCKEEGYFEYLMPIPVGYNQYFLEQEDKRFTEITNVNKSFWGDIQEDFDRSGNKRILNPESSLKSKIYMDILLGEISKVISNGMVDDGIIFKLEKQFELLEKYERYVLCKKMIISKKIEEIEFFEKIMKELELSQKKFVSLELSEEIKKTKEKQDIALKEKQKIEEEISAIEKENSLDGVEFHLIPIIE